MAKLTKKQKIYKEVIKNEQYICTKAFETLLQHSKDFESMDVSFVLGIDYKKSDQVVKGIVDNLPSGLGKKVSIAVLTKSEAKEAIAAGADYAGEEDLITQIKKEEINPDVYIATSQIMPELIKLGLGRILKSKMPNPKLGTVIEPKDIAKTIEGYKKGKLAFRSNNNIINASIGRCTFTAEQLEENFKAVYNAIIQAKPAVVKPHQYIKKIFISSTMSASIEITRS